MTYNVEITAGSFDNNRQEKVFAAYRVEREHLAAIIEHVVPLYNPLSHTIVVTANITREEAEGIK